MRPRKGRGELFEETNGWSRPGLGQRLYLKSYRSQIDAYTNLDTFFRFDNEQRPHNAFANDNPRTPMEVYRQPIALAINQ